MAGQSEPSTREQWVTGLFESAGYDVVEEVGEHGNVHRFATPRSGLVRPRIWWVLAEAFPDSITETLERLLAERVLRDADRGWLIVWGDDEPGDYQADLHQDSEGIVTRRHLAMVVLGALEALADHVTRWEREGRHTTHLRRRAATSASQEVDACNAILAWAASARGDLVLLGDKWERETVIDQAIWQGVRAASLPHKVALLPGQRPSWRVWLKEWSAFVSSDDGVVAGARTLRHALEGAPRRAAEEVLSLLPPTDEEVCANVAARIRRDENRAAFIQSFRQLEEFREHFRHLALHDSLVASMDAVEAWEGRSDEWVARVAARFFRTTLDAWVERTDRRLRSLRFRLERAAFELYSLGDSPTLDEWTDREQHPLAGQLPLYWFHDPRRRASGADDWRRARSIPNALLRDYLVARWIVQPHSVGRAPVAVRHTFPERWVLLFVALIAPEVAARLSADRGEEQRKQMEAEIERRVQLTFAHLLKRSAGAVTAHLETVEEHLTAASGELPPPVRTALDRLRQEIGFQRRLAERSRVLHDAKGAELVEMPLDPPLRTVLATLRREHARIDWAVDVEEGLTIRAFDDAAHEMLHCVIENAAHAALYHPPSGAPRVEVSALREGDTVVVLVRDHGGGVRAEDRERIFDPLVTTKKGGALPMGTGFGLTIARRYASLCGARVTLLDGAPTTFELRFVAGVRA